MVRLGNFVQEIGRDIGADPQPSTVAPNPKPQPVLKDGMGQKRILE
jgi:hypothetical protein